MRISSAFPSKYLKAADLAGREVQVKIDDVRIESMETSDEAKPVVYFIGAKKGVVLNKTNAETISAAYGDDTDEWHGHPIVLFESTTSFGGRTVPCLRVRIPRPVTKPAPLPPPPQEQVANVEGDTALDEIPF